MKYKVPVWVSGTAWIYVDAESNEEALSKAKEIPVTLAEDEEWTEAEHGDYAVEVKDGQ